MSYKINAPVPLNFKVEFLSKVSFSFQALYIFSRRLIDYITRLSHFHGMEIIIYSCLPHAISFTPRSTVIITNAPIELLCAVSVSFKGKKTGWQNRRLYFAILFCIHYGLGNGRQGGSQHWPPFHQSMERLKTHHLTRCLIYLFLTWSPIREDQINKHLIEQ